MARLKKLLKRPPVRTNQIPTRHFLHTYVTPIIHHLTILEELNQKHQEIIALQRKNAATKKEKANEKSQQMEAKATGTHQHIDTFMNENQHSNEHYQNMIFVTLEGVKLTGMMEHNTTIDSI